MRRRLFLSSLGLTALAGCSSNGNLETPDNSNSHNPSSGPFELVDSNVPNQVPSTAQVTFTFRVQNTGSESNAFTSTVEEKQDGTWSNVDNVRLELDSGEVGNVQTSQFSFPYLGTHQYRLTAFDRVWSIEVVPLQLRFQQQYVLPNGLLISVLGGSFESEYPRPNNETASNATATPTPTTPADDNTWLVMRVDLRNRLQNKSIQSPDPTGFTLTVNGQEYQPNQSVNPDPYESQTLTPRMVIRDSFVYAVPSGTAADDVSMSWETSLPDGELKAIWSSSSGN